MQTWKKYCAGLVLAAGLTPQLAAQDGVPAAVPGAPGAPAAAPQKTIWSCLGISSDQLQACKQRLCQTQFGQLLNNGMKPVSAFTGGVLGNCCPPVNTADLLMPPDSAQGAAARIKKDEAEAKARRAAVRYLGTVDCHYWPEAQDALVNALRGDRNECVRWEAAMALGSGCCCTKATIKALSITAAGSDEDGNPCETSERVKQAADYALHHCLACLSEFLHIPLDQEPPPELLIPAPRPELPPREQVPLERLPPPVGKLRPDPEGYYQRVDAVPLTQLYWEARRIVSKTPAATATVAPPPVINEPSVYGLIKAALSDQPGDKPAKLAADHPPAKTEPPVAAQPPAPAAPVVNLSPLPPPAAPPTGAAPRKFPFTGPSAPAVAAAPVAFTTQTATAPVAPAVVQAPAPAPVVQAPPPSPYVVAQADPPPVAAAWYTGPESTASVSQLLAMLTGCLYPDQREWAVNNLAQLNPQAYPQVLQAVLTAAREDRAPLVRVACLRCLAQMNINSLAVVSTVEALTEDTDPRVHYEADRALARLTGGPPDLVDPASVYRTGGAKASGSH